MTTPPITDPQTYALIGAAMDVHRALGAGFLEAVYREAYLQLLGERQIPYRGEVGLSVVFQGRRLGAGFRADLVCYGEIIVELKAVRTMAGHEQAQVLNYLKASGLSRALLFNFGAPSLEYRRLVWTRHQGPPIEQTGRD